MKSILKSEVRNRNFRTPKQHSITLRVLIALYIEQIKYAVNACLSLVSALYPGRESNPHACLEHRILSPACLPIPPPGQKNLVISHWPLK